MNAQQDNAEEEAIVAQQVVRQCMAASQQSKKRRVDIDHRLLPRNVKRVFRHEEALQCLRRDYFGVEGDLSTPLFAGSEFKAMFRISRSRFQRMMEDFSASEIPFYRGPFVDMFGKPGASLEARLLLPLKVPVIWCSTQSLLGLFPNVQHNGQNLL